MPGYVVTLLDAGCTLLGTKSNALHRDSIQSPLGVTEMGTTAAAVVVAAASWVIATGQDARCCRAHTM